MTSWTKAQLHLDPGLRNPLLRNGYALVLNVGLTSALGVTFWVIAAREYTVADVGRGSALVSALITLSTLGQLNLTTGLLRFLPRAGSQAGRLIGGSYAVAGLTCVALGAAFILIAPRVSPGLSLLPRTPLTVTGFCAAVLVWSVFALQDSAITGLRRSVWIPLENGVYGVVKIGLLVLLAEWSPGAGVFTAWVGAAAVILLPVNLVIFRRWVPAHRREPPAVYSGLPRTREMARLLGVDYLGSVCYFASTAALPLLVVSVLGPVANGYFYVAWTVASCLDLVSTGLAQSLTVEASHSPDRLAEHLRTLLPRLAGLHLFAGAVLIAGAPLLLSLYGGSYAAESSTVVRLLILAALPRAVIIVSIAVARVERQAARILAIQAVAAAGVLGLSLLLADRWGIRGVAVAWLITQTALASVLLPRVRRRARAPRPAGAPPSPLREPNPTGRPRT
jgi:O-antigen/teichoic acid export membrane protein